ncbi:hypothetical protein [Streptomyces xantholiticus]|uniref:hypothetical protein n=1 Tax=Streptomyces xantholiticus TaxID=68285 RepID=UPI001672FCB6|nr:hypothetical protein [Streptomyces xantholiticus]
MSSCPGGSRRARSPAAAIWGLLAAALEDRQDDVPVDAPARVAQRPRTAASFLEAGYAASLGLL